MNLFTKFIAAFVVLMLSHHSSAYVFESDSTEDRDISFVSMVATLSSKIIHFRWDVEREKKGAYFQIEKSIDKETWKKVTRVKSIGNHNERHTYEVSEINFAEGAHEFFRIKRVDNLGKETVLDVVNVNHPVLTNMLLVPVQGKVNKLMSLSYDSKISGYVNVSVIDEEGVLAFETQQEVVEGYNRLELNIKLFDEGIYTVRIRDAFDNKISKRLTVYGKRRKK
ncbi:MAG: hypothetical protein MK105_03530 [Crocinitomicaceae bacterium]|nr:hypothetical protein [Crocinitomicaceae bacterium]